MSKLDPTPEDKAAAELAKSKMSEPSPNANLTQKVINRLKDEAKSAQTGNTVAQSVGGSEDPFHPDVRVSKAGFSVAETGEQFQPDVRITPPQSSVDQNAPKKLKARPATSVDLSKITEADVLSLDFIDAKSFDVPAMLQLTPKDPNIRFRWVNYKNYEGGNYAMFKAIGFLNASPEDVASTVSEHLTKEDGTIKWFDVILMKVPTLHLMGLYKKNIIRALMQVGRWQPAAIEQAKRTIEHELGSDIWQTLKREDKRVEFYAPSATELASQDKDFLPDVDQQ